jgi:hypothetical protein
VRAYLPPPRPAKAWRAVRPTEITLGQPPAVALHAHAISGNGNLLRVAARASGFRVETAHEVFDVTGDAALPALAPAIAAALARSASTLRPERLVPGERYRVVCAFGDVAVGATLRFRRAVELKPSGADAWLFEAPGAEAEAPRTVTLRADVPADAAVLDALGEHLSPIP